MPAKSSAVKWSDIKKKLATLDQKDLVQLLQDLYDASADNRLFLAARLVEQGGGDAPIEAYRKKIDDQFFPVRGFGKLKLGEARKAIRDYRKATNDTRGTLDLMLTYVEQGTEFTNTYGDITEAFYTSLEDVLQQAVDIFITPEGRALYSSFYPRLVALKEAVRDIGWGYGDNVMGMLRDLDEAQEEEEERRVAPPMVAVD